MPRLKILYDVDGWAFHRRALALQRYARGDYEVSISAWGEPEGDEPDLGEEKPDVVFCLMHSRLGRLRAALDRRGWDTAVVGSWTTGWPLWISRFHEALEQSDLFIVNHHDAWVRMGKLPGTEMIPNGVDRDTFRVTRGIGERTPKVLWTGSMFHSSVKGYRSHVLPLFRALRDAGIDAEAHRVDSHAPDNRSAEEMAQWFNDGTVLVCASALEGTPNPALEAAACGCTVVSTPVGNMPELIRDGTNGYLVERTVDALFDGVQKAVSGYERLASQMQEDIEPWSYQNRAAEFFAAFDRACERACERARGRPAVQVGRAPLDIRDDLTVFVTTVGAPSYRACRQHIEMQDTRFDVHVVDRVAPMSAAFQQMIDRCKTPFYVQVDEDMLLYPHAIRHLHGWIKGAHDDVALCAGALLDAHLRRQILGVKVFRHEVVRRFPHEDVEASESNQLARLAEAGFQVLRQPIPADDAHEGALGLHGTHWTPALIFERYATLERKRRRAPETRAWVAECAAEFLERHLAARAALAELEQSCAPRSALLRLERESELDLYALLGSVAGSLTSLNGDGGEKDFRTYGSLDGFEEARRLVRQLKSAALVEGSAEAVSETSATLTGSEGQ